MEDAGIATYEVEFSPANKSEIDVQMEPVEVRVTVDYQDVAWLNVSYLESSFLTGSCSMPADIEEDSNVDGSIVYDLTNDDHAGDGHERDDDYHDDD